MKTTTILIILSIVIAAVTAYAFHEYAKAAEVKAQQQKLLALVASTGQVAQTKSQPGVLSNILSIIPFV